MQLPNLRSLPLAKHLQIGHSHHQRRRQGLRRVNFDEKENVL